MNAAQRLVAGTQGGWRRNPTQRLFAGPLSACVSTMLATVLGACRSDARPEAAWTVLDPHAAETVSIAAPHEALTFARADGEDGRRVLAVTRYEAGVVEGVDLAVLLQRPVDDPVAAFLAEGYDKLHVAIANVPPAARVRVKASTLVAPVDLRNDHIAAGTNFPEHAEDAGVEDGPFLFAKLVTPTAPYDAVPAGDGLLDYEVEVAWVTLEPLAKGAVPKHMGVILCNDYTDRATLLRHLDPWNVASGDGFTTGKSFPGYLPIGNLFVIPRDFRAFVRDLELRLYVNAGMRQQSPASAMVWDFDEMLAQTWARQETTWEHRGRRVALPGAATGTIPERTLLLSGTPHGTVFDGIATRQKLSGAAAWLLGGWGEPIASHVLEAYIRDARAKSMYLRSGDTVTIHVERAGIIRNVVQ